MANTLPGSGRAPRRFASLWTVCAFCLVLALALVACSKGNTRAFTPPIPRQTEEPSQADLIQAVRNSVAGHTYPQPVSHTEWKTHVCSQYDVDLDPNAKHNPELARCPYAGKTYSVSEVVSTTESRPCQSSSAPDSAWSVQSYGNDSWRVSVYGSAWDVTKLTGQANSVGDAVRVSQFAFSIKPHQPC